MTFSPEAKRAARTKRIEGEWEHGALERLLQELKGWEAAQEKRASLIIKLAVASFATGLALFTLGSPMGELMEWQEGTYWAVLVAGCCCLGYAVLSGVLLYRRDKTALPGEILEAVGETLRLVRGDLYPGSRIRARVDLSEDRKAWLELRFRLRDKYVVTLRQADIVRVKTRTSQSASGRTKNKSRYRRLCRVTATLRPPSPIRWSVGANVNAKWERLRIKPGRKGDRVVLDRWFVYKYKPESGQRTASGKELVGVLLRACSLRPAAGG